MRIPFAMRQWHIIDKIYVKSNYDNIERRLQLAINRLPLWVLENGLSLSLAKTRCVHFNRLRGFSHHAALSQ
jgi:hypothetical protein